MSEFLLTREPWLPVVTPEGTDTLGLIDVFDRADGLMVAPRGPLEERAIHRLLLAISYASLGAPTQEQYPRAFDGARVAQWLREHEGSFDLLSTTAPFAQDATLTEDTERAHLVSMANLDSTVARSRPLITDHRRVGDVRSVPLPEAIITLLVYNLFDAPGIHEGVKTEAGKNSPLKGTEGGTLAFVPKGLLATALSWAVIPVDTLGTPNWTYTDPKVIEKTPDGDLDALTWHFRRLLLHHDGVRATGVQVHQGHTKTATVKVAPDTLPGQRNYVLSASNPLTTAATGEVGQPTSAGRGNPLDLIQRWEAGSDTSLAGHVRAALGKSPDLAPPHIVVIGQRLENTALKVLTREALVPRLDGGHTDQITAIRDARRAKRLFPSDDHRALALLDVEDADQIDAHLENLRVTPPADEIDWPTNARPLSAASQAAQGGPDAPEEAEEGQSVLDLLAAVVEVEERATQRSDGAGLLRRIRFLLRDTPEMTARLALATTSRVPTLEDVELLGIPSLSAPQRLWAGLLAVAIHDWRRAVDGDKPLPSALRQAGARLDFTRAADVARAASGAPDLEALRVPLLEAVGLFARSYTGFSWWSLADDLENWSPQIAQAWRQAFTTKTTPTQTAVPDQEEK